jgi:hypothetical protein
MTIDSVRSDTAITDLHEVPVRILSQTTISIEKTYRKVLARYMVSVE